MDSKATSHLVGGFLGGLTSSVLLQPFDLLKTRLQQNHTVSLASVVREMDSLKMLWRGTLPSAIRTSVGSALYLSSLNVLRTALAKRELSIAGAPITGNVTTSALPKLSTQLNLMTGFVARAMVGYLTMPITVLKVRYESTLYNYTSIGSALQDIFAKEGMRGFVRGSGATIARDAPYAGLYVGLYEWWKDALGGVFGKVSPASTIEDDGKIKMLNISTSAMINSSAALLSASLATTITAPFDTIKTRMQLKPTEFKTFGSTFYKLIKFEGWLSLFDGLGLRLGRKALSAGIAWGIYEEIVKYVVGKKVL